MQAAVRGVSGLLGVAACCSIAVAQSLTTTFSNGVPANGVMFDLACINPNGIRLTSLTINAAPPAGNGWIVSVFIRYGTYVGHESSSSGWTNLGGYGSSSGSLSAGPHQIHQPSELQLALGEVLAVYIDLSPQMLLYTPIPPAQPVYANSDIEIRGGVAKGSPFFTGPTIQSAIANLTVQYQMATQASCYANCDSSTTPPFLSVNDFICFQEQYAAGSFYCNCDTSTTGPLLNVNDFICFLTRFAAGCSSP